MAQQKIELRKLRDFGENISDTFQFIRQEFKPLLTAFLIMSGVFIVAGGIVGGIYQSGSMSGIMRALRSASYYGSSSLGNVFNGTYFLMILLSLFGIVSIRVVVASYMKVYDAKAGESPTLDEIWTQFKHYIVPLFFYSIIIGIMIVLGMVLCIAPGIYLAVVFAPIEMVLVVEDVSLGQAISRCFNIVKENFWISFAIYLVAYIIYSFSSGIIGAIIGVIAGLASYFSTKDVASTVGIVTGILNIFTYTFYIIFAVSVGLHYFNLVEKLDGDGLMRKLENLGNTNPNSQIEEQY